MLDIFFWIFWILFWIVKFFAKLIVSLIVKPCVKLFGKLLLVWAPLAFRFFQDLPQTLEDSEYWFVDNVYDFSCFEPENIVATRIIFFATLFSSAFVILVLVCVDGDNFVKRYFGVSNPGEPQPRPTSPPSSQEPTSQPQDVSTTAGPTTSKVYRPLENFTWTPFPSAAHIPRYHYTSDWRYFLQPPGGIESALAPSSAVESTSEAPVAPPSPAPATIEMIVPVVLGPKHPMEDALVKSLMTINGLSASFVESLHYWQNRDVEEISQAMKENSEDVAEKDEILQAVLTNDEMRFEILTMFMYIVKFELEGFAGKIPPFDLGAYCPWAQEAKKFWEKMVPQGLAIKARNDEREMALLQKFFDFGNLLELNLQPLDDKTPQLS
ncbi:hypothetical protein IQ07DRAFT_642724 [Pyrenochaeta sp. DS3sAY3a]|nr:hypothetical protein IQ07DRAFT_642724 [Pyrenochaeta sp. DS3sAY3a]